MLKRDFWNFFYISIFAQKGALEFFLHLNISSKIPKKVIFSQNCKKQEWNEICNTRIHSLNLLWLKIKKWTLLLKLLFLIVRTAFFHIFTAFVILLLHSWFQGPMPLQWIPHKGLGLTVTQFESSREACSRFSNLLGAPSTRGIGGSHPPW